MGPRMFCENCSHDQFVWEADVCKGILLTKQVNLVAWLLVGYLYHHIENNLYTNFFSTALACCLCYENIYKTPVCHLQI